MPQWVKDIPALEATAINTTGMLTLKEVLAEIEDAELRAELLAQAAEDEAALEAVSAPHLMPVVLHRRMRGSPICLHSEGRVPPQPARQRNHRARL